LLREVAAQIVTRETNTIRRYVEKYLDHGEVEEFLRHIDDLYGDTLPGYIQMKLRPPVGVYAEALMELARGEIGAELDEDDAGRLDKFVNDYVSGYAARHIQSSRGQIGALLAPEPGQEPSQPTGETPVLEAVSTRVDDWDEKRPDKIASDETVRLDGAVALMVFVSAGFDLRWVAVGHSCPYCEMLNGMIVGKEGYFLKQDQELQPEGEAPMHVRFSKRHPPAHQGCDCIIVAAPPGRMQGELPTVVKREATRGNADSKVDTFLNELKDIFSSHKPDIYINVPERSVTIEPTVVNIAPPDINVEAPVINIEAPVVNIEAPPAPEVHVDAPIINFEAPKRTKRVPVRDEKTGLITSINEVDCE